MRKEKEHESVEEVLRTFLHRCFTRRDIPGTLELLSPGFFGVGVWEGERVLSKEAFAQMMHSKVFQKKSPISYTIADFGARERAAGCWDCSCMLSSEQEQEENSAPVRLTAGFHWENDRYLLDTLHLSQGRTTVRTGDFAALQFAAREGGKERRQDLRERMELLGQVMPGGILGGYLEEGFPLYVANQRFLDMVGCKNLRELEDEFQGLIINMIHPQDRKRVREELAGLRWPGDQYEIQHRLKRKDGSSLWVHNIGRRTVAVDGQDTVVSVLVDISRQVHSRACLERAALTDPLTGIRNRKSGEACIQQRLQQVSQYLFVIIDVDRFKHVNDIYGHDQGDEALCAVAGMLRRSFRKTDVVYRLGGDEFAIFVSGWDDVVPLKSKLQRLIDSYRTMMEEKWPEAGSTLSMGGVYSSRPVPFQELYRLADQMLYQVKKSQKGRCVLKSLE